MLFAKFVVSDIDKKSDVSGEILIARVYAEQSVQQNPMASPSFQQSRHQRSKNQQKKAHKASAKQRSSGGNRNDDEKSSEDSRSYLQTCEGLQDQPV